MQFLECAGSAEPRLFVDQMQAPLGYFDPLGLSKDSRQHGSSRKSQGDMLQGILPRGGCFCLRASSFPCDVCAEHRKTLQAWTSRYG